MLLRKKSAQFFDASKHLIPVVLSVILCSGAVWAQVTASITGSVKDSSGAVVPDVAVTVKNVDTGLTRTVSTDAGGNYSVFSLPVGQYEINTEKSGFKEAVRKGITLVVAQQAVINLTLEVGNVEQQVTVTGEAPLVNTTLSPTSGLVNETEVKDLPLNGRSFDQLLTLNVGTVNYGAANTSHPAFSVAGRRPEANRFIINGMDYVGSDMSSQTVTPNSVSGYVLGVEAMREFNVVEPPYGAEYGKRGGGQISIVTNSGTNQWHGDVFEFLRNSDLDARNFFDLRTIATGSNFRLPPFKRNQFGGTLGGPIKKDKLFFFLTYEGFRQRLGLSDVSIVPDNLTRAGEGPYAPNPSLVKPGMLQFFPLWPTPNGGEFTNPTTGAATGLALAFTNPGTATREDFGLARGDYTISDKDTLSATFINDNGELDTPSASLLFDAVTKSVNRLFSIQETRIISPQLLNVVTLGYDRAFTPAQTSPLISLPSNFDFIQGEGPGTFTIGGGIIGTVASSVTGGGASTVPLAATRNLYTVADELRLTKGIHSLAIGVWIQRDDQALSGAPAAQGGTITYSNFTNFLQDSPTQFVGVPNPTALYYGSTEAAWYVQDDIKVKPNLTLRLGLRDEMTSGWNEAHGNCPNYLFTNGIIDSTPHVGPSCLIQNNSLALWQPRVGIAWDPTGTGTWAVRAGFGIYNDLQDSLAHRLNSDPPANSRISITNTGLLSFIPLPAAQPGPQCSPQQTTGCYIYMVGGLDPNMHTPTVQEWNLTVERQITKNMMLQLGYVGSQSYHLSLSVNANTAQPQICQNAAGCPSGGTAGPGAGTAAQGALYLPPTPAKPTAFNSALPNPYVGNTFSWWYEGVSSYQAGTVSLTQRFSKGLTFKTNYTYSKILDLNSAISASNGTNEPQTIYDNYDLALNKGIAAYSLRHQFNANFSYELPFGNGKAFASGATGIEDKIIGGWQWNGIFSAQSGFPFTPQTGSNRSGNGDTFNPDVPNVNPAFSGPVIVGKPTEWFNPAAFTLPCAGCYGNVSRGSLIGPKLFELDTSLFKGMKINERLSLQFRAEIFNLLNHANFKDPTSVVYSGTAISPSAGVITATQTTSRQIQFALKLIF